MNAFTACALVCAGCCIVIAILELLGCLITLNADRIRAQLERAIDRQERWNQEFKEKYFLPEEEEEPETWLAEIWREGEEYDCGE